MKCLLLLFLFVIIAQPVGACDCLMTPVEQHIKRTPYLLTGQVLEILDGRSKVGREERSFRLNMNPKADTATYGYTAKLRVEQSFKGKFKANNVIPIDYDFSNCAVLFEVGKKYILFLHEEKGTLFTTHCSYSESLDNELYPTDLMERIYKTTKKPNKY